jgi:molybdate transport system substrate-binding protein
VIRRIGVGLALLAAVVGCANAAGSGQAAPASSSPADRSIALTVLAAASLRDVLVEVKRAYASIHPDVTLTVTTDSSATLASQIIQGAPADVFLAADATTPQRVVDAGLADGEALPFASNQLAVIVPTDAEDPIRSPADLARPGLKVIAAGPDVPITRYATMLIDGLARTPGYPPRFAAAYAANVVSREDNVKAVVAKIELGEGDAAIVYATDAAASTKVASIPIPDASQVRTIYAGVVLRGSAALDAARVLMDWIRGPDGQAILARAGFQPPRP